MAHKPLLNRKIIAALHDAAMAAVSYLLAFYLRLGEGMFAYAGKFLPISTLIFTALCVVIFRTMRLYRGLWRYASLQDLVMITKAASLAVLLFFPLMFILTRLEGMPRSVPFINWLLLLALLGGPRFLYRVWKDRTLAMDFSLAKDRKIPVLLVGAGDTAELFLREMMRSPQFQYRVVGIVDDDPTRIGRSMHNIRINGGLDALPDVVAKLARRGTPPQRLILTDTAPEGERVRVLLDMSDRLGIPLARLPSLTEFKSGVGEKLDIRPIVIEDLLGRSQNLHDRAAMQAFVTGKRVMVTGAGGTIGSELVRQLAGFAPSSILLFEASEFNLYQIDRELAERFPGLPRQAVLADVRDAAHVDAIFAAHRPELVFHAAAIKHVPLAEENIEETLLTNVFGTQQVADACLRHGALAMVLISTDKAVNPANVMGASKRLAETYCQALGASAPAGATHFITVRFGNVLGSTGSVVPLFQKQLEKGGPITVTHPDMVRFFMTVREAVELVVQAAGLGAGMIERNGQIFVLDMGTPVRIEDLALQMIRLAGLRPHEDIKLSYTGLRPGEKLFEELFYASENTVKTSHESIMLASPRPAQKAMLEKNLPLLYAACTNRRRDQALALLQQLVPEYQKMELEKAG